MSPGLRLVWAPLVPKPSRPREATPCHQAPVRLLLAAGRARSDPHLRSPHVRLQVTNNTPTAGQDGDPSQGLAAAPAPRPSAAFSTRLPPRSRGHRPCWSHLMEGHAELCVGDESARGHRISAPLSILACGLEGPQGRTSGHPGGTHILKPPRPARTTSR